MSKKQGSARTPDESIPQDPMSEVDGRMPRHRANEEHESER
jgi:hypothetical protein